MHHPDKDVQQGLAQWRSTALAATRQLAKRQLTWLRGMPERTIVACDAPDAIDQVLAQVLSPSQPSASWAARSVNRAFECGWHGQADHSDAFFVQGL